MDKEIKEVTKKDLEKELTGQEPMLSEPGVLMINKKKYYTRRLNMTDTFKIGRILMGGATRVAKFAVISADRAAALFVAGLPYAEDEAMELFSSYLETDFPVMLNGAPDPSGKTKRRNVTISELKDYDYFPMGSEILIIESIISCSDMKIFFRNSVKKMKDMIEKVKSI